MLWVSFANFWINVSVFRTKKVTTYQLGRLWRMLATGCRRFHHYQNHGKCLLCSSLRKFCYLWQYHLRHSAANMHTTRLFNSSRLWIKTLIPCPDGETIAVSASCILHSSALRNLRRVEGYIHTIVSEVLTFLIFMVFQGNICTCVPIHTVSCPIILVSSSPPFGEPETS